MRTTYQIGTHVAFHRCLPKPHRYAETNASLFKVTEKKAGRGEWVVAAKVRVKFQDARGQGKKSHGKKRRNPMRADVRVIHNGEGLSLSTFSRREVDHTNKDFRRIDWRRLRVVAPQGGH